MEKQSKNTITKILCLEDTYRDAELMRETLLKAGIKPEMDIAATKAEYIALLNNNNYDVILGDYSLPSFDAPEALAIADMMCPNVPFICVSGAIGEEAAVEFLKQGATDYILKDRLHRLPTAVNRAIEEAWIKQETLKANAALKESQVRLQSILNNNPGLIWISGKNNDRNWFNDAWLKYRGKLTSIEQFNGWLVGVHPDDRDALMEKVEKAFQSHRKYTVQYRLQKSDGQYRWFLEEGHPRYNADKEFLGYIGNCLDITNQIIIEQHYNSLKSIYDVTKNILKLSQKNGKMKDSQNRLFEQAIKLEPLLLTAILTWDDKTEPLTIQAFRAEKPEMENYLKILSEKTMGNDCSLVNVFKSGKTETCTYLDKELAVSNCKDAAISDGIRAVTVLPLIDKGKVTAAYLLCADDPGWFDKEGMKLLEELAGNISLILENNSTC